MFFMLFEILMHFLNRPTKLEKQLTDDLEAEIKTGFEKNHLD